MAAEINRTPNARGEVERFGMTIAVEDGLDRAFADRAHQLAQLTLATLTETPYTPHVGGKVFSVEVSNRYHEEEEDTVELARLALAESLQVRTEGMSRGNILTTVKSGYSSIAKELLPKRRDGQRNSKNFNTVYVESARSMGVEIVDVETGLSIVRNAPLHITGLKLTSYTPTFSWHAPASNDMVTVDGRIMKTVRTYGEFLGTDKAPDAARDRGGKAPRSTIVSDTKDRVVNLRTKKQLRK